MRAALAVVLLALAGAAHGAGVERLLMPGEVAAAHAKYEEDCGQCHDRKERGRQTQLCLACHKEVAADVAARRGLHGRMPNAAGSQCSACHSEHQGRAADLIKLDAALIDHAYTDFPLTGAHAGAACAACHQAGKPHRGASSQCVDCHRERDPHAGALGKECASCHEASSWSRVRFDHARTQFPLRGAHAEATCASCHPGERYAQTPQQCAACHAADDVHRGERGPACASCHTSASWSAARFDHARETGFALLGAHGSVECRGCHRSGDFSKDIPTACQGCHRADDPHAARLGSKCDDCHSSEAWRPSSFDHVRDAHYALLGKHAEIGCHRCHTAEVATQKLSQECAGCHRLDDVHAGGAGIACQQCHGGDAWRPVVGFDHDLTDFPLVGMHAVAPCAACHTNLSFGRTAGACNECHARDDVHQGGLGAECSQCHTANAWNVWEFDHAAVGFALDGAHAKAQCADCHREPPGRRTLSSDCASCHRNDDVHLGQFGRKCGQCHTTATFRGGRRR
jgi:hypothetical protein